MRWLTFISLQAHKHKSFLYQKRRKMKPVVSFWYGQLCFAGNSQVELCGKGAVWRGFSCIIPTHNSHSKLVVVL